jgi:hypothetical protein
MPRNPYFNNTGVTMGSSGEQNLIENLVVEQIKMFGMEVYYIPRTLANYDSLFGEDAMSTFSSSYQIEAYFPNAQGLEGEGSLYTKFGIRIAEQTTFVIARKRFKDLVDDNATLIAEGRPNEGDLIYMPLSNDIFEIKFVDHQSPFYPLGKGYVWELRCELFEYSDETLDTGISEVDEVEDESAYSLSLNMSAGGTGTFVKGETVYGRSHEASIAYTHQAWNLGFSVWDGGDGYDPNDPPSITFSAPDVENGVQATGTVQVNSAGKVTGVTLNPGSGYTSAPSFTLERSPAAPSGEVVSWNPTTRKLVLRDLTGTFKDNEVVKNANNTANWTITILDSYAMDSFEGAMNKYFETKGNLILDFSEKNPFGEIGNMGDKF